MAIRKPRHIDRPFLFVTIFLVVFGFFIFSSASLGLLARNGANFSDVAKNQFLFGIGGGMVALLIFSNIPYRIYKKASPYIFLFALFLTSLVFVPGVGVEINGAHRWLNIFGHSFQPAELLKISFVLCISWYYSVYYRRFGDIRYSLGGFLILMAVSASVLLMQPDTGTFLIISSVGISVLLAAGIKFKHLAVLVLFMIVAVVVMALSRPYLVDRITTFFDPSADPSGSGYQIKQSLIAVGSGKYFGRGFGQSVQKFSYLPEPISDSIFSVFSEEFGFFGSIFMVSLFAFFAIRGLQIAGRAPDRYGGLVVIGIVILITAQSFMNISSMIGIIPLTGEPLTFISHGGTSLLFALAGVGIVLNISRYGKVTQQKII